MKKSLAEYDILHTSHRKGTTFILKRVLLTLWFECCMQQFWTHHQLKQTMNFTVKKQNAWFLNKRSTPVKLIMVKSQSFSYHSKTPCITHIRTINFQMLALWPKKKQENLKTQSIHWCGVWQIWNLELQYYYVPSLRLVFNNWDNYIHAD